MYSALAAKRYTESKITRLWSKRITKRKFASLQDSLLTCIMQRFDVKTDSAYYQMTVLLE